MIPALVENGFNFSKGTKADIGQNQYNAQQGIKAIQIMREELERDPNIIYKSAISGGVLAAKYKKARNEVVDIIARLRTGAVLTENEEKFYGNQLPTVVDAMTGNVQFALDFYDGFFNSITGNDSTQSGPEDDPLNF